MRWLLACQHRRRHAFTGANPGGWGWTDLSGAVPDADDTPAALLALAGSIGANRNGSAWNSSRSTRLRQGWRGYCDCRIETEAGRLFVAVGGRCRLIAAGPT
ncbi:MAG: hypothetical protein R3C56_24000 [Pirellulaceae bacterium]